VARVRFNHVELTVPPGTLDADIRADLSAFYTAGTGPDRRWQYPPAPVD